MTKKTDPQPVTVAEFRQQARELRELFAKFEQQKGVKKWSREIILQGFIGDVGDLTKLCMATDGYRLIPNTKQKLAHELSDCLWSILTLAEMYDVDIEDAYLKTVQQLKEDLTNRFSAEHTATTAQNDK